MSPRARSADVIGMTRAPGSVVGSMVRSMVRSMPRSLVVLAAVLPLPAPRAQAPAAPAGESAPMLTPHEACAAAFCASVAAQWRTGGGDWRELHAHLEAYEVVRAALDTDGSLVFADPNQDPARFLGAGQCLLYVAPVEVGAARHVFCVRGDGVAAFTANEQGVALRGERRLAPDAALGEGGKGTLRDFARTPQRGRDGNLWQPFAMLPQQECRVLVVDEAGEPMPLAEIAFVAVPAGRGIDAPLPAGMAITTFDGDAVVRGFAARGLGVELLRGRRPWPCAPETVRVDGRSVRITIPAAALRAAERNANESAAIATLKNIASAQAQCQASGVVDVDNDGAGEYGTFAELAGAVAVRGGGDRTKMSPPVLSSAFGKVQDGVVVRSGYCFRLFLPGKDATPLGEQPTGGAAGLAVAPDGAEAMWCAYAWPVVAGTSGQRVFFVNQSGDVLAAPNDDGRYSGATKAPAPTAAFEPGAIGMNAKIAANRNGVDGQQWRVQQ